MRRLSAALLVPAFPLGVLFVMTARPARLYAETAPPPLACTDERHASCDGKRADDPCTLTNESRPTFCLGSALCRHEDGGFQDALSCLVPPACPTESAIDACRGQRERDPCRNAPGACVRRNCLFPDGGRSEKYLACDPNGGPGGPVTLPSTPTPPAPTASSSPGDAASESAAPATADDGCSTSPRGAGASAFAGLVLAAAAFVRLARRRR